MRHFRILVPAVLLASAASAGPTTLSGIVSDHYTYSLGQYQSGGTGLTGYCPANSYNWYGDSSYRPAIASQALDHHWVQGDAFTGVTWDLGAATATVVAFGAIDHGPIPIEAYEFAIYGSNDGVNWTAADLSFIVSDGWIDIGSAEESDDWSTIWQFQSGQYRFVRALANYDGDFEMDAIGAATAVPAPSVIAVVGLAGLAGRRRSARA